MQGELPVPPRAHHSPGSVLWLVVPTKDSALAQDTPSPLTQPPQGCLGSVQDVEAAQLFWLYQALRDCSAGRKTFQPIVHFVFK